MILAIDSSLGTAVALVTETGDVAARAESADTRAHAEVVGVLIAEALAAAGIGPEGVARVVIGAGPGPYTGLRVGMAAGQAFALARGIEVEAIVSHDAVALRAVDGGRRGEITVATDARRRELFVSQYTVTVDGNWQRTDGPIVVARDEVLADEADESTILLADSIDAAALARVALARRAAGLPAESGEARYLRPADVTIATTRKRVTG